MILLIFYHWKNSNLPQMITTRSLIATPLLILFIQHCKVFYLIHNGATFYLHKYANMFDLLSQFVHDMQCVNTTNANKSYY